MMDCVQFIRVMLGLALLLAVGGEAIAVQAQEVVCAPSPVGDGTGVYFLALGENCSIDQAEGYRMIAHLVRDDDSSEVLVLIDAAHDDAETALVAQFLTERVMDGTIDGGTWHPADAPSG